MSWDKGFNFRGSAGYVTDGADETYVIASDAYPTTRNGVTFGLEDTFLFNLDRDATVDRRLAGMLGDFAVGKRFRVDLLVSGNYAITVALGDAASAQVMRWKLRDNTTELVAWNVTTTNVKEWYDATGVLRTDSSWPATLLWIAQPFLSSICRIATDDVLPSTSSTLAHLRMVAIPSWGLVPICLVPAYREIVFDPLNGFIAMGFRMQIFLPDGTGIPMENPDSASLIFDSTQAWSVTKASIVDTVIARALEFGLVLSSADVIVHLPPIERG